MHLAGIVCTLLGFVLLVACLLVLWILATEVIAFEIDRDGSIFLQRLWLKPLTYIKEVRPLIKLGCVFRAGGAKGECVPYVIVWADKKKVTPMPAELYSRLSASIR